MNEFALLLHWENLLIATIIMLFVLIHFLMEPLRWIIYTKTKDKKQMISFLQTIFAISFLTYIIPAKLGIPVRFWLIKKHQNLKAKFIGLFIIVEQVLMLISWIIVGLLLSSNLAMYFFKSIKQQVIFVVLGLVVLILLFSIISRCRRSWIAGSWRTIVSTLTWTQIGIALIFFLIDIASYMGRHFYILYLLNVSDLSFITIASITVLSILAGFVSATPMGLGGYDASIIFLLSQQGVPLQIAFLVPIVNRTANLLVSILLGIPSIRKLGLNIRTLKRKTREIWHA